MLLYDDNGVPKSPYDRAAKMPCAKTGLLLNAAASRRKVKRVTAGTPGTPTGLGGGGKTKQISMKNIGLEILILPQYLATHNII